VEEFVAAEGSWRLPGQGGGGGVRIMPTAMPPIGGDGGSETR
jgi:hypothetical protein